MMTGEILMVLGTVMIVIVCYMTNPLLGILGGGIACIIWGYFLLKAEITREYMKRERR